MTPLLVALLLSSNASGKTLVRTNQGTTVPISGSVKPVIAEDSKTVAHVYWNGSALKDTKGNAWAMNGTVPQVARAAPVPAGAGPFSSSNYYSLGTGIDVLDFAGDFSACFMFKGSANANTWMAADGLSGVGTSGWAGPTGSGCIIRTWPGSTTASGGAPIAGATNVCCIGRSGTTLYAKLNLGTLTTTPGATVTPDTAYAATIGTSGALAMDQPIYEVWFSTTTPTDALFISVAQNVKTKLGISAW